MNKASRMHSIKPTLILAVIVGLASVATALMIVDAGAKPARTELSAEFQRLVGGLGFGPALDLTRCPNSFDPRLDDGCAGDLEPLPGGARFCPLHAGSIFYYPPLERAAPAGTSGN